MISSTIEADDEFFISNKTFRSYSFHFIIEKPAIRIAISTAVQATTSDTSPHMQEPLSGRCLGYTGPHTRLVALAPRLSQLSSKILDAFLQFGPGLSGNTKKFFFGLGRVDIIFS